MTMVLVLRMETGKLLVDKLASVLYLVSGKPMLCPKTELICHSNHTRVRQEKLSVRQFILSEDILLISTNVQ